MMRKWECCNGKYTWINIVDMLGINAKVVNHYHYIVLVLVP